MPKRFKYTAKVKRTIEDTVSVVVTAEDTNEGYQIARRAVLTYPEVTGEGIPYCYVENRDTLNSELVEIKKEK